MIYPIPLKHIWYAEINQPVLWSALLTGLGYVDGQYDETRQVTLGDVARINGAAVALYCAHCLPDTVEARRAVLHAILPSVRLAASYTTEHRVHYCLAEVTRWSDGDDSVDLEAAATEAKYAAEDKYGEVLDAEHLGDPDAEERARVEEEAACAAWAAANAASPKRETPWAQYAAEFVISSVPTRRASILSDIISVFGTTT